MFSKTNYKAYYIQYFGGPMVKNFSETNYRANYKHYLGGPLVHLFRKLATDPTTIALICLEFGIFCFEFIHAFFFFGERGEWRRGKMSNNVA